MPIYDYRCNACGHRFDVFYKSIQSAAQAALPLCPACQSADTLRVVSSFALHGPAHVDAKEASAQTAAAQRSASVTSKEQINSWRNTKK
jgi:putative FmdB family regulatory protein